LKLKAENGHMISADSEKLSYIKLAAEAALIDPLPNGV
jgi:hypothetical protein